VTAARKKRGVLDWKAGLGIAVSIALLYYALRDVDRHKVLHEMAQANPWLYIASIVVATSGFVIRAWRWKPLLEPVRKGIPFRPRYAAVCIGFMANNLLPARVGEFLRAYALARLQPITTAAAVASLVLERLFDGATIVAFVFLALRFPGFPDTGTTGARLHQIASTLSIVFAIVGIVLLAMVLWPKAVVHFFENTAVKILPHRWRAGVIRGLEAVLAGLSAIRNPLLLVQIIILSIALWTAGALSYWLGLKAFGINVPFLGAVFLQSLISLAVALPSGPGFFGPFEAGVRVGLVQIWNIDVNKAVGFAIGFHLGGFIPVTVIGLYYVWRFGMSLTSVQDERIIDEAIEGDDQPRTGP
jgi:uncharacterized protein (TIRG00374 family)